MTSPLVLARPVDRRQQIHDFARDLAYGAIENIWKPSFITAVYGNGREEWTLLPYPGIGDAPELSQLDKKWTSEESFLNPSFELLESYGYVIKTGGSAYQLTQKAFDLLEKPAAPPEIFISYRRNDVSSTFALLIEARLKLVGVETPFIDKGIQAGEDWRERLHNAIKAAKYLVVLVSQTAFDSEWVLQEITWAQEAGCTLISIWQPGMRLEDRPAKCPPILYQRQAIKVNGESARDYEAAVNELLNALGYRTY